MAQVPTDISIVGFFIGRAHAINVRNEWQSRLDFAYIEFVDQVEKVKKLDKEIKDDYSYFRSHQKSVESHRKEADILFKTLNNLLKQEREFVKNKDISNIIDKIKSFEFLRSMNRNSVVHRYYVNINKLLSQLSQSRYLAYPHFRELYDVIIEKLKEIRETIEKKGKTESSYDRKLYDINGEINKAHDRLENYNKIKYNSDEGIQSTRYFKSLFFIIASEKTKSKLKLDTNAHKIKEVSSDLKRIEAAYSKIKTKHFEEVD